MHDIAMEREQLAANIERLKMLREQSGALIAQSHQVRARSRQVLARSLQLGAQVQAHIEEALYLAELETATTVVE